jgi:hypothetical protein
VEFREIFINMKYQRQHFIGEVKRGTEFMYPWKVACSLKFAKCNFGLNYSCLEACL